MTQLTYTVPVLGSTGWGVVLNDILTEIKTNFNALEGTTYTASRALVSDASGKVSVSTVTSAELGYLSGVTSAIQTQLNAKEATITGAATTITSNNLTASFALASDANGKVAVSSVTLTELSHLSGVTSAIQTQLDNRVTLDTAQTISAVKTFSAVPVMTGTLNATDNSTNIPTTAWVRDHCCTTAATTSSTASKDAPAYVVQNYKSGNSWYRVWSDGWIEQGGYASGTTQYVNQTINLNKSFTTTSYFAVVSIATASTTNLGSQQIDVFSKTKSSFQAVHTCSKYWYACGY